MWKTEKIPAFQELTRKWGTKICTHERQLIINNTVNNKIQNNSIKYGKVRKGDHFERNISLFLSFKTTSAPPPVHHTAVRQRPAIDRNPSTGHCPSQLSDLLAS